MLFRGLITVLVLCALGHQAFAADIAGNDAWMPISKAVERYELDPAIIDAVLDGGVDVGCVRKTKLGKRQSIFLNGFFLNDVADGIHTSAHFLYIKNPDGSRERLYDSLEGCYAAMNRDVSDGSGFERFPLVPDIQAPLLGSRAAMAILYNDRAVLTTQDPMPSSAVPFAVDPTFLPSLSVTTDYQLNPALEIFLVSSGRRVNRVSHRDGPYDHTRGGFEPQMQRCEATMLFIEVRNPAVVFANCDWFQGDSGSLALTKNEDGRLTAIGLLRGGKEVYDEANNPVDGLPYDPKTNSTIILGFDIDYFAFVDRDGNAVNLLDE